MVVIQKKDKSLHLCVDCRKLNVVSQADAYPMPCMDDLVDQVGNAHYIHRHRPEVETHKRRRGPTQNSIHDPQRSLSVHQNAVRVARCTYLGASFATSGACSPESPRCRANNKEKKMQICYELLCFIKSSNGPRFATLTCRL